MSYASLALEVMSIVGCVMVLRAVFAIRKPVRGPAALLRAALARSRGVARAPNIVFGPDRAGGGWARIDRALQARAAIRIDAR